MSEWRDSSCRNEERGERLAFFCDAKRSRKVYTQTAL